MPANESICEQAVGASQSPPPVRQPRGELAWRRLRWGLRVAQVRLRFLLVLGAAFLIVGKWQALRDVLDRMTAPASQSKLGGAVSSDTEYFCPMCPGVVSDWPNKCSVCNMPLVRRRKGEAVQLPDGVLSRMQFSPYRVQLAGIRTSPAEYLPLARVINLRGSVRRSGAQADAGVAVEAGAARREDVATIEAEISEQDILMVSPGAAFSASSDAYPGHAPWRGEVTSVEHEVSPRTHRVKVRLAVVDPGRELWPGMCVDVHVECSAAEWEPFRSQPADLPSLMPNEPRKLYVCPDHPLVIRERKGNCPEDQNPLRERRLTEFERIAWQCPLHPSVSEREPGRSCGACNGMQLLPRIVNYRPAGQVLAVPETAVMIDADGHRMVYLERMPDMFDCVEVVIGPRCGGFYPVISGLAPGERVATAGAFLVDAESRLNPSVVASYFGAVRAGGDARAPAVPAILSADAKEIRQALAELQPADRLAAERQKSCPVTGMLLGSMGAPIKMKLAGREVWLCCEGCRAAAEKEPRKYLEQLSGLAKP